MDTEEFREYFIAGMIVFALSGALFLGCASVPAECVVCPPPIQLDVSSDSLTEELALVPCTPELEGCYGFTLAERDFYKCEGGQWVPVDSPF